ncbi:hypothetical protein GGF43_002115, partial [Coemansia sp. RSA 2618]
CMAAAGAEYPRNVDVLDICPSAEMLSVWDAKDLHASCMAVLMESLKRMRDCCASDTELAGLVESAMQMDG